MATPLYSTQASEGVFQAKLLEREVGIGSHRFSIGNIFYVRTPKSESSSQVQINRTEIAKSLGKAMGITTWRPRLQKNASVFEGNLVNLNRFVRIYMSEDSSSFTVSIATVRTAYLESFIFESEYLQRGLAGVLDEQRPWLKRMMSFLNLNWVEKEAFGALPVLPNSPTANLPDGALGGTIASNNLGYPDFGPQITGLTTQVGGVSTQLGGLNSQLQNTNAQLPGVLTTWNSTNQQIGTANTNWSTTNGLVEKLLNPQTGFLLGLAAGAGTAMGGAIASLAVSGVSAAAKMLYEVTHEAVTHKKRDAEYLDRFEKAMQTYKKIKPEMEALEDQMDHSIVLAKISQAAGGRERLLLEVEAAIQRESAIAKHEENLLQTSMKNDYNKQTQKSDLENLVTQPHLASLDLKCPERLDLALATTLRLVKQLKKIQTGLESQTDFDLCKQLDVQMRTLRDSENLLQKSRVALLDPDYEFTWERAWEEANPVNRYKSLKGLKKANLKIQKFIEQKAHSNLKAQIKADPELNKKMRASMSACTNERYRHLSQTSYFYAVLSRKVVKICSDKIMDVQSPYASLYSNQLQALLQARDEKLEVARNQLGLPEEPWVNPSKKGKINPEQAYQEEDRYFVDPRFTSGAYASYKNFFSQLKEDQTLSHTTDRIEQLKSKQLALHQVCRPSLGSTQLTEPMSYKDSEKKILKTEVINGSI
jgi:hypothetical protein